MSKQSAEFNEETPMRATKIKDDDAPFDVKSSVMTIGLNPFAFMVYIYVLWRVDREGEFVWTNEEMAQLTGLSVAQVGIAVDQLREKGLMEY